VRKRLVIAAIAVLVVGPVAYLLSLPRNGSVEWHKREYLKARDGSRLVNNLKADWYRMGGPRPKPRAKNPDTVAEMEIHERALIALGYMEERKLEAGFGGPHALTALSGAFAMNGTLRGKVIVEKPIARIVEVGSNFVVVRSAREDMPKWEAVVVGRAAKRK
jgi:hypothetical protein